MAKYNSLEELRAAKDKRFAEEKKNPYSAINTGRITKQNYSQVNPHTVSTGKSVSTSTAPTSKTVQTPELDAAVGNTPDFVAPSSGSGSERPDGFGENLRYTLETRIPLMLEGAGQQFLSSAAEAGRGIWDFLSDSYKYGETEESAKREDRVSPLLTGYADAQARQAEESIATAKQGLGTVGQFLVDAGVAGTQMAADVGIAALTGGSSLAPMAVRSFGSGVQQARNKGYDLNQQMALGLGSAATEWATEKLFGGNPLYDQANSGVINKVIAKVTQNEDILKFLSSRPIETLNEGLEEILSGVINPAIELAITGNADWPTVEELIRDGAIGVALGGAGQVVNAVVNGKKDTPAATEDSSEPESPLIVQEPTTKAETGVQEYTPIQKDYGRIANDILRDPELLAWYESEFGPVTGSNTQKAKTIAHNLAQSDLAQRSQQMEKDAEAERILAEVDAKRAEQEALNSRTPEQVVVDLLRDGSQSAVNSIIRNSEYLRAFSTLTGTDLSGMSNNEKRNSISAYLSLVQTGIETLPEVPTQTSEQSNLLFSALMGDNNQQTATKPSEVRVETPKAEQSPASPLIVEEDWPVQTITRQSPGMKRSQTESNSVRAADRVVGAPKNVQDELYYEPKSEAESTAAAQARYNADPVAAENYLRNSPNWSGVDVDTAGLILGAKANEARASGNWDAYREWRKVVQEHGTEIGRSLQSFAKWSRTPGETALDQATDFIEGLDISEEQKNSALTRISPFCESLDAVDKNNVDDIKALILRMNSERRTGTIIPGALEKLLNNQSADYLYKVAQAQLQGMAHDYAPHDIGNMVKSWQTIAQLLKLTTTSRNLLGNEGFGFVDALIGNTVGQAIDQAVSKATGVKAIPYNARWFSSTYRKAAVDAMEKSMLEIALDVDMGSVGTKYDPQSRAFRMSGNPAERFVSRLSQLLSYSLTSTDKLSRGGIEAVAQASLEGKNTDALASGKITAEQLSEVGEQSADYSLFQNKGKIAQASKGIHDTLNLAGVGGKVENGRRVGGFGAGDVLMPYATVPANLGVKPFEMSPVGIMTGGLRLAKVIKDAKAGKYNPAAQHQAIMEIARGTTGVPLAVLFSALAKAGIIKKSDDEDEYDVTNARKTEGRSDTQWNIDATMRWITGGGTEWQDGDTLISLNWLQPINAFMEIGAMFNDLSEEGDATLWDYAGAYANGTIKAFLEMPVVTALQDAVSAVQYADTDSLGEKVGEFFGAAGKSLVTGMMPGVVSNAGKAIDPYQRDTSGDTYSEELANAILANIPGARQSLPVKQDAFGNDMDTGNPLFNALNSLVLPGAITEYAPNDVVQMLDKVYAESGNNNFYPDYKAPGNFSYGGTKYELSTEEQRAYKETFGQTYNELAADAVDNATFNRLSATQQAEVLSDIRSYATAMAKDELITSRGEDYDNTYADVSKLSDPVGYFSAKTVFGKAIAEDSRDYAAVDSLMGHYGSLAGDVREKLGDDTRMDDLYEASRAGIDSEAWYKAYDEWKRINNSSGSSTAKATDFSRWVDTAGFSDKQADVIKGQLTFGTYISADPAKYNDLTGAGISAGVADQIYDAVSSLEPVNFNSTVANWQKYEAIAGSGATTADIDKAMSAYMSEETNDPIKYQLMRDAGYTPQEFAAAFHYYKTATSKDSFVKLVTAAGLDNAEKLYALMGANKKKLSNWKW